MPTRRSRRPAPARAALCLVALEPREVPTFLGNQIFPLDNPWNQSIAGAPVAANSQAITSRIAARNGGVAPRIHPDLGNPNDGALYGIPVNIATSATPKVSVFISPTNGYPSE
ncbi:MAG: hypothetical protein K2V38_07475, partial [Gemmataceae bacterium]|nr:hypothetical protein [Gemmataceae bacterium]